MRIAALAFGVIAGLIASLILALGGLEVAASAGASPDRQMQVTRFGLFVIANLGVFGAGLVLASPIGGAALFLIGAVAWIVAALLLHGGGLVIVVPPAFLFVAMILSAIAVFQRGRAFNLPPLGLNRRKTAPEPEEFDDLPPVPVGAGFFGEGGTAQPLRNSLPSLRGNADLPRKTSEPNIGSLDERDRPPVDWSPGKRRPPPPRQKPMFRPPDDEYEESRPSRIARGISSVLSFGLYAAVAGGVMLVAWNLRTTDGNKPAAAKLEPAPVSVASTAAPPAAAPVLTQPARTVADTAGTHAERPTPSADQQTSIPPQLMNGVVVAQDPSAPVTFEAPRDVLGDATAPPTQTTAENPAQSSTFATDSSAGQPAADPGAVVMPYPMPAEIAAARTGPSNRRVVQQPSAPLNSTGL